MSEGILHREPAIINREHQNCEHVTTVRPAWWEGEVGQYRRYAHIMSNMVIGDEIDLGDGRKLTRGTYGHYTLWANDLQVIVTLPKPGAMIEYLQTGKVCKPSARSHKPKTSQYIGVCRTKNGRQWKTQITVDGVDFILGYFNDEEPAARAWDSFVIAHGLNRPLNFPQAQEEAA